MQYHASINTDNFASFFQHRNLFFFFFFFCLIAGARPSSTVLNKSGKNGHPCFVPDLTGKHFRFSPLSMKLTVDFSYIVFIMLRYFPSMPSFWRVFIVYCCWILSNVFYVSFEMIMWLISFFVLMGCIMLIDLQMVNHHCISWMNLTWS